MMRIRNLLNAHPVITVSVAVILAGAAVTVAVASLGTHPPDTSRAFFTVDDGKTWFVDSSSNIPPYQKDGKTAYRCSVYDCNGRQFVLEMQRYDEKSAKLLRDAQSAATGDGPSRKSAMASASAQLGLQVKSPGDAEWKSVNDFNAMNKISAAGKCGTGYSTPVIP